MFVDVRGFSTYAEQAGPEEVVGYLNKLFDLTIGAVNRHHGTINQLLGDGFMAVFGVPISYGYDSLHAVKAAMEMVVDIEKAAGDGIIPPMRLGIGSHGRRNCWIGRNIRSSRIQTHRRHGERGCTHRAELVSSVPRFRLPVMPSG